MQQTNQNLPDYTLLLPLFERYLERWNTSPAAERVESVDGLAVVQGRIAPYEGVTIPEFILDILREYTDTLRNNPALLIDPRKNQEEYQKELQQFLDSEQILIDTADDLAETLKSYKLSWMDPRWHKTKKELKEVVSQFRLTDEDYQVHLPSMHHENQTDIRNN